MPERYRDAANSASWTTKPSDSRLPAVQQADPDRPGKAVMPGQRIGSRNTEEQPPFAIGQKLPPCHAPLLSVPEPSIMIVDGDHLWT